MQPELVAIAAVARNGVIGAGNAMPWKISSDLKHFKALTMGKPLILGRRTYQSLERPLPGRRIIVMTRDPNFRAENAMAANDPLAVLALARQAAREMGAAEIMIGGGGEIYQAFLSETARIELTEIALEPRGDAFFPGWICRDGVRRGAKRHRAAPRTRRISPSSRWSAKALRVSVRRERNMCCGGRKGKLYSGPDTSKKICRSAARLRNRRSRRNVGV